MSERYSATIDLGSSVTSLALAKLSDCGAEVVYYGTRPSEGIRRGQIFNIVKCSKVVEELLVEAENSLAMKISQVCVALPRYKVTTSTVPISSVRSNPDAFITEEEVANLADMAENQFDASEQNDGVILGNAPQFYSLGDSFQVLEEDVIGACGERIEGTFKIFSGPAQAQKNIDLVFNHIGRTIAGTVFVPAIQGYSVLTREERENGAALVEIGAGVTSVSIWNRGVLRCFESFPFGGNSVTSDIRTECSFSEALAENVKLAFGACLPDKLQSLSEKELQIEDPQTGEIQRLKVKYLAEIIGCRMDEICRAALHIIAKNGFEGKLRSGIVLCGGAAETVGLVSLMKDLCGMSVRKGYPRAGRIITSGFAQMEELDSTTQYALIANSVSMRSLNCCIDGESPSSDPVQEQALEPEAAAQGDNPTGSLFSPDEFEQKEVKEKKKKPFSAKKSRKDVTTTEFEPKNKAIKSLLSLFDSQSDN